MSLSARRTESGDLDGSAQRNRTANDGAADRGLAAIRRIPECESGDLDAAAHDPGVDVQTGDGDPVVDSGKLAIEPRQLALADHIDEAGPRLAVQRLGLRGVALRGPVTVGRPHALGQ